ncbi:hypothetical protein HDV06_004488 [Boothiomyces sp. JEL0866]|nr:hypothetical protein HDV06_004488 [Boothiomyces sp. JEL0866]
MQSRKALKPQGRANQYFDLGQRGRKTGWVPSERQLMNDDADAFFQDSPQGRVRVYPHYPQRPVSRFGEQDMIVPMPIYDDQYYEPVPVVVDHYNNQYREEPIIYNDYDNRMMDPRLMTPRYRKLSKKAIPSTEPRRVFASPVVHAPIYPQSATKSSRYSMAYDLDDFDEPYRHRKISEKFKPREDSDEYISDQENRRMLNYDSERERRKLDKKKKREPKLESDSEVEKPVKQGKKRGRKSLKEKEELQRLEALKKDYSDDSVALSDDEQSVSDVKLTQSTSASETPRSPVVNQLEVKKSKEKESKKSKAADMKKSKAMLDEPRKSEKKKDTEKSVAEKKSSDFEVPVKYTEEEEAIPIRKRFGMTPRSVQRKQKEEITKILDKPIEPVHFLKDPVNLKPIQKKSTAAESNASSKYPAASTPEQTSQVPPVPESVEKNPLKMTKDSDENQESKSPILSSNEVLQSSPMLNNYNDFNTDFGVNEDFPPINDSSSEKEREAIYQEPVAGLAQNHYEKTDSAEESPLVKPKKSKKKAVEKKVKVELANENENGAIPTKKKRGRPAKNEKDTTTLGELNLNSDSEPVVKKPKIRVKKEPLTLIEKQVERPNISESDDGVRKSKRTKVPPCAFWRNEKVIYGRRDSGIGPVVTSIQEVLRIPSDDESIPVRRPKVKNRIRVKKEYQEPEVEPEPVPSEIEVMNYVTKQFEFQKIAVTPNMLETHKSIGSGDYRFQKVFSEGDFIASGVLEISKGAEKPNKNSHASAMIFVVLVGHIQVTVNKTEFNLSRNGQFFVPRGNQYSIKNVGQSEAKIFFCHGKLVPA